MTQLQAIRRVLTLTDRFIIADYNGQKWYVPDGYMAVIDDIYSMYKPRKYQVDTIDAFRDQPDKQPLMNNLIETNYSYVRVKAIEDDPLNEGVVLLLDPRLESNRKVAVNRTYYEFIKVMYPSGTIWIDANDRLNPVRVYVRDYINHKKKLVSLVMPLKY